MARESLEHSFIPGASLWSGGRSDGRELRRAAACADEKTSGSRVSGKCEKFMGANERARVQWQLEKAFTEFEKNY